MAIRIELVPSSGAKSFYGKAYIMVDAAERTETLYSYDTPVLCRKDGKFIRLWDDWSATTGRHIKEFSGLTKAEFMKLPMGK